MIADIVVVGAGPAGSTAAEVASAAGLEVLLVDRKAEIGSPVQCGGFLPELHELNVLMPRAELPSALKEIPERYILHRTKLQRMYPPSGKSKEITVDGRVIDRRSFDRYLAHRAARAGAIISPATRAYAASGELKLSGRLSGSCETKIIIGADGPHSAISRLIGNPPLEMALCIQYEMADVEVDPYVAEMYFSTHFAPGGYAWIIPMGPDLANVGVGVRQSYLDRATLPQVLERFIRDHPLASQKLEKGEVAAVMRGAVPAAGMPGQILKSNILLAGDAAGHVMATSGGGIPLAMVAGKIAGEASRDHLMRQASIDLYRSRIESEFGRELENSVRMRRMVDMVMHSDKLMDALFGVLDGEQIKSIMRGQIPDAIKSLHELLAKAQR